MLAGRPASVSGVHTAFCVVTHAGVQRAFTIPGGRPVKALSITIGIAALILVLAITNPTLVAYQQYLHQTMVQESKKSKDDLNKALGMLFGGFASSIFVSQTKRSDYVILSTYDTDLGVDHVRTLGILKNVYGYDAPKNKIASGDGSG